MKSVLITGAARGIGRASALHFASKGWNVYAGVRNSADGEALVSEGGDAIVPLTLDVTNDEQIAALGDVLPDRLDALVNNAGIAIDGPVEALTRERLRQQFEVNVDGQVAVTRAVLPKLRAAQGRIVFISSVSGRIATPWTGAYNASKYAIEAIADALRMELRPWKIRVSLVEPVNTATDMWGLAGDVFDETMAGMTAEEVALYAGHAKGMKRTIGMMQKTAVPVERVVKRIDAALTARHPKARYPVGATARAQLLLAAVSPTPIQDRVLALATGVPRKIR
ncbi:MAG: SDR family oxidoreductase [Solirubrobacterales bacterium]